LEGRVWALKHFRFTCEHYECIEGGFFFKGKPLETMDSVKTRIENAVARTSKAAVVVGFRP
jgi:hypothetical protein